MLESTTAAGRHLMEGQAHAPALSTIPSTSTNPYPNPQPLPQHLATALSTSTGTSISPSLTTSSRVTPSRLYAA
ncbi:hypothetical protein E2C01_101039 [Portunus trituberculatus]|uniref:Uncharacterized protein n=1 Tax=Portunus trituberculatus TaxID=210409 RepID=A0A5B7KEU8_PORTR|nr:hypothetical protein [Portunus trituberculatus]